jgi:hypothetical protein
VDNFRIRFLITKAGAMLARSFIVMAAVASACVAQQPQLQIAWPTNGSVFNPGQSITLTVTSPTNTSFASVAMVGEDPFGFSDVATSLPAQVSVMVPTTIASGTYMFTADGVTTTGQRVESAPILVDIERADFPQSLSFSSAILVLTVQGDGSPLVAHGHFSDGSALDVTRSTYMTYSSSNTSVVTVDSNGLVTAVGRGSAFVIATYNVQEKRIQTSILVKMSPGGAGSGSSDAGKPESYFASASAAKLLTPLVSQPWDFSLSRRFSPFGTEAIFDKGNPAARIWSQSLERIYPCKYPLNFLSLAFHGQF